MDHQHQAAAITPHVLIFPLPLQSTVNSMLKLAEILCLCGLHVTFLNTKYNQQRLVRHTNIDSRIKQYDGRFHFETISDGLPDDHPRLVEHFPEMFNSLKTMVEPFLRERLSRCDGDAKRRPVVTGVIAEGYQSYAIDVAKEVGVPVFAFETISPCCLRTYLCIPDLVQAKEIPFTGNDMDRMVASVPGMEGFLRLRDLPVFCRGDYTRDPNFQLAVNDANGVQRADGLILNTFEDLDRCVLSQIRSKCPNLYAIGPVHHHLTVRLALEETPLTTDSNSFWEEDISCMKWLDSQPPKSVIFVSIGSLARVTKAVLMEVWHGLVNSGTRFLWVIRLDSVQGEILNDEFIKNLSDDSGSRGCIVKWAPQEKVLAHAAIGGFLTHTGWGSTMESIVEGVPMLCWPHAFDQHPTSRFVSEVWKLGLVMKDACDISSVEKLVKDLMETRKVEFRESAEKMSAAARKSVARGGTSYLEIDRLVSDIKTLGAQTRRA